jgi:hypothetical protein
MAQDNTPVLVDDDDSDGSVSEAAAKIEALLSDPEDPQTSAAHPTKGKKAPAKAVVDDDEDAPPDNPLVDDDEEEEPLEVDEEDETEKDDEPVAPASKREPTVKVTVDGEEEEVPLSEALAGYSRNASFTKKSQKLAEDKRAHEADVAAKQAEIRAQSEHYVNRLQTLEAALSQEEPNWDQIRQQSPETFAETHAAWQIHQGNLGRIRAEREREQARLAQQYQAQHATKVQREREALIAVIPEWGDQTEKGKAFRSAVREYGLSQGFTGDELKNVADHRAFKLLHKAYLYDKAVADKAARLAKGKGKVDALQKTLTPAAKNATGKRVTQKTQVTELKARAKKSGSVDDAAAAIEAMLG